MWRKDISDGAEQRIEAWIPGLGADGPQRRDGFLAGVRIVKHERLSVIEDRIGVEDPGVSRDRDRVRALVGDDFAAVPLGLAANERHGRYPVARGFGRRLARQLHRWTKVDRPMPKCSTTELRDQQPDERLAGAGRKLERDIASVLASLPVRTQ
jgi:hypothetical protein